MSVVVIESREQRLLKPLLEFFSYPVNFNQFLEVVVTKTKQIPLRLLDWLVTNYAKSHDISYNIQRPNGRMESFHLYRSYKDNLKILGKSHYDVSSRGQSITLEYNDPVTQEAISFQTALCQLKFFRWAIENLVIDYALQNYETIYADMDAHSKSKRSVTETPVTPTDKKKKIPLTKSVFNTLHVSNQITTFSFGNRVTA